MLLNSKPKTRIAKPPKLPRLRPTALHPPVQARLDLHLVAFTMLLGEIETLFRQRDIDDALAALILVENDLLVVGSPL